jgi:inner membrane protein
MDSLTHLVLGAAIGEAILGKKIGNRALIWGAIGETIPDLDVLGNLFLNPTDALAFHRGFTHSILFSVLAPLLFGGLIFKLYHTDTHKSKLYKIFISALNVILLVSIVWGINYLFSSERRPQWFVLIPTVAAALYLGWRLYKFYLIKDLESPRASFKLWYLLFFAAFFTHIMLDSCTTFGTQLFLPFSDYRVAFNNIAVADLFYTVPFLICTLIFMFMKRGSRARTRMNYLGIGISSAYLLFTVFNKCHVDHLFDKALHHRGIEFTRCRTSPAILNNFLWDCLAEGKDEYYFGLYSNFDTDPNLHYINVIPKNDSIRQSFAKYREYQTLLWFSDGYLAATAADTMVVLTDLRYGGIQDTIQDYHDMVFNFFVQEKDNHLEVIENHDPQEGQFWDLLKKFIIRVEGY